MVEWEVVVVLELELDKAVALVLVWVWEVRLALQALGRLLYRPRFLPGRGLLVARVAGPTEIAQGDVIMHSLASGVTLLAHLRTQASRMR